METNKGSVFNTIVTIVAFGLLVFAGMGLHRSLSMLHRLTVTQEQISMELRDSVARLETVAAGLAREAPAGTAAAAPPAGTSDHLAPTFTEGASLEEYRAALRARCRERRKQDAAQYGDEVGKLYSQAVPDGPNDTRESRRAFGMLVERFPVAYATGIAIAERGLRAAMAHNTPEVETFRDMLVRNAKFKNTVTDAQIEAVPALSGYLATRYAADGRKDDALDLLDELLKDFRGSYVAVAGVGGAPKWIPVTDFAERVKAGIDGESAFPPMGPGPGPGGPRPGGPPPRRN